MDIFCKMCVYTHTHTYTYYTRPVYITQLHIMLHITKILHLIYSGCHKYEAG